MRSADPIEAARASRLTILPRSAARLLVLSGALVGLLTAGEAYAQVRPWWVDERLKQGLKQPVPMSDQVPKGFRVPAAPDKPYVAFTLGDLEVHRARLLPQRRTPIAADTLIPLRSGRQVTAAEFLSTLNDREKAFNAIGLSFREKRSDLAIVVPAITRDQLLAQAKATADKHVTGPRPGPGGIPALKEALRSGRPFPFIDVIPPGEIALSGRSFANWDLPMGDRDSLYVNLNGNLELVGKKEGARMNGLAKVDCSFFGSAFELTTVMANLDAPRAGLPMTASLDLKVLGSSVPLLHESATELKEWEDDKSLTKASPKYKLRFQVGPIPVTVTLYAQGTLGVKYYMRLSPGSVIATVTPYAEMGAVAEVAADIEVLSTGIGGELTILKDELEIKGIVQVLADEAGRDYVVQDYYALNEMETLSGRFYAYVDIFCPVCPPDWEKRFKWYLWDWEGFHANHYLFRKQRRIGLE